jgi:hypothetical protein
MNVYRQDGSIMKFKEYKSGLYYYDATDHTDAVPNPSSTNDNYLFLLTVAGNKASFTRREFKGAGKS